MDNHSIIRYLIIMIVVTSGRIFAVFYKLILFSLQNRNANIEDYKN